MQARTHRYQSPFDNCRLRGRLPRCYARSMRLTEGQLLHALARLPFADTLEFAVILGEAYSTVHRALSGLLADSIAGWVNGPSTLPMSGRRFRVVYPTRIMIAVCPVVIFEAGAPAQRDVPASVLLPTLPTPASRRCWTKRSLTTTAMPSTSQPHPAKFILTLHPSVANLSFPLVAIVHSPDSPPIALCCTLRVQRCGILSRRFATGAKPELLAAPLPRGRGAPHRPYHQVVPSQLASIPYITPHPFRHAG